ncbi:three component ABC system middle component [Bradyrhizobium guangdongense]
MDSDLSLESRRLLNPAFAGLILIRAVIGFHREAKNGFPFIYSYLVLPLVLHPETRERLPQAIVTRLPTWAERNGELTARLPRRVADLAPATREALFLAATTNLIALGRGATISASIPEKTLSAFEKNNPSDEVAACLSKANFVGRWLATSGTVPTVLTVLGVQI